MQELKSHRPDTLVACEAAMSTAKVDADFVRVDKESFLACPADSVSGMRIVVNPGAKLSLQMSCYPARRHIWYEIHSQGV